ncbi:transposase [Tsuneonella sp. HG222]
MPRVIELPGEAQACELGECVEALEASGFDPFAEESLLHAAGWLRRLGHNPDFLADIILRELKNRHREDTCDNSYSPQVIMLSGLGGEMFMRANIWPSEDEHMVRASGGSAFVYGMAHDHNFDFLTYGYFGPGYWSDYYEYNYGAVAGAVGEPAGLRFVERSRLDQGKLLHYRGLRDVHAQMPPDSLSISLNVMHADGAQGWYDQYGFDLASNTVSKVLDTPATDVFLRIAVGLGVDEALDLAETFARTHPSDRMRLTALEAQAGRLYIAGRDALWRRAEGAGSRLVMLEARRHRAALAAN